MKAAEFTEELEDLFDSLEEFDPLGDLVRRTRSFERVGVLTKAEGLVVTMKDGSEFQLTVVQSK